MPVTVLIITRPSEALRLGAALCEAEDGLFDVHVLPDPDDEALGLSGLHRDRIHLIPRDEELTPGELLSRYRPDVLILGTGQLGIDVVAYIHAAKKGHPHSSMYLVCDESFARRGAQLLPGRVLIRPVSGPDLVMRLRVEADAGAWPEAAPSALSPPALPIDESDLLSVEVDAPQRTRALLRVDDLLPDPLALFTGEAPPPVPQAPPAAPAAPELPEPPLYEDALAGLDLSSLEDVTPLPRPMPPAPENVSPPEVPAPAGEAATSRPRPIEGSASAAEKASAASRPPPLPIDVFTPPAEGDLGALDPPRLLGWICTTRYSGCLMLAQHEPLDEGERALYFDKGELVSASSRLPEDSLHELLYHEGRLSREQLRRARALIGQGGGAHRTPAGERGDLGNRRAAQVLHEERLLQKSEIVPLLRRHAIEMLYRSLAWERGRYRLVERTPPREDRVRLKETCKLLLLEGLRRKASLDMLISKVGPETTVLEPIAAGGLLLRDAGVTAFEQRALPLFDGQRTLAEISRQSGLAEHATYVLAYALICLCGLRKTAPPRALPSGPRRPPSPPPDQTPIKERHTPRETRPPPVRTESKAQVPSKERDARELQRILQRVRDKYRQVEQADYFTLLEVDEGASAEDIRSAHERLVREFSEAALPAALRSVLSREISQIALVLDEAYTVLADEDLRSTYRARLLPLQEPARPPAPRNEGG